MWFKNLTGFEELSPEYVRENLTIETNAFRSKANNQTFSFGSLELPTLEQLRTIDLNQYARKIQLREVIADVQDLHCDISNENALFQVASQFNLLEMVDADVTPDEGVDSYEIDFTQGPACAIACGAATIYRNYFVPINEYIGQTENLQIDCLELISAQLGNQDNRLWKMKNGYVLSNTKGILEINSKLHQLNDSEREKLKGLLKIGIQWNAEVTLSKNKHKVSQAFCSALPVSYNYTTEPIYWEKFARLILEATYEATLYAGVVNMEKNHSNVVYLTLVGGGAFGNHQDWIIESIEKVLQKFANVPLDIRFVSHSKTNPNLTQMIQNFKNIK